MTLTAPLVPIAVLASGGNVFNLTVVGAMGSALALVLLRIGRRRRTIRRMAPIFATLAAIGTGIAANLRVELLLIAVVGTLATIPSVASGLTGQALGRSSRPARVRLFYTLGWVSGSLAGGALATVVAPKHALTIAALAQSACFTYIALRQQRGEQAATPLVVAGPKATARWPRPVVHLFVSLALISCGGAFRVGPLAAMALQSTRMTAQTYSLLIATTPIVEIVLLGLLVAAGRSMTLLLVVGAPAAAISFSLIPAAEEPLLFLSQGLFAVYVVSATVATLDFLHENWPSTTTEDRTSWTFSLEAVSNFTGGAFASASVALVGIPNAFYLPASLSILGALGAVIVVLRMARHPIASESVSGANSPDAVGPSDRFGRVRGSG